MGSNSTAGQHVSRAACGPHAFRELQELIAAVGDPNAETFYRAAARRDAQVRNRLKDLLVPLGQVGSR